MQNKDQLGPSEAVDEYLSIVSKYLQYLKYYGGQPLWGRLLKRQDMTGKLYSINEDIDNLFKILNLASMAAMMDWKQQWEDDIRIQHKLLEQAAKTRSRF
ncbi:unnamed protein product [Phytophthora lilii]|uniref:Unnamed protein product n=1 Tax=Phytophthora lilii TaxID=2077276 RepID=A0A9W6TU59_9STRA|nr:unnamed protein product [Phytophthora lilii]